MTDWDADSEQLKVNLHRVLSGARNDALERIQPTVETARQWHTDIMRGLTPPGPNRIGRYRGEKGLEGREVVIGSRMGTGSDRVAGELKIFESQLQNMVTALDELIEPDQALSSGNVAAVIDLCAWIHSEWVRIHPFANEMAVRQGYGPTLLRCVMACHLSYACVPGQMAAMARQLQPR